ncbi:MAG: hypothetical protein P8M29_04845, partial [Tateyamaria sp.]|nr:hypothetical protein [Tateyamaria sp.]
IVIVALIPVKSGADTPKIHVWTIQKSIVLSLSIPLKQERLSTTSCSSTDELRQNAKVWPDGNAFAACQRHLRAVIFLIGSGPKFQISIIWKLRAVRLCALIQSSSCDKIKLHG